MFPRSFRARLTTYFFVIVVLPMVVVLVMLFRLAADSERAKSDARLGQAQKAASGLFRETEGRSAQAAREIGRSPRLARAIRSGDGSRIDARLGELAESTGARRIELVLARGGSTHTYGTEPALAQAATALVDDRAREAGSLRVSVEDADGYVSRVRSVTGFDAVVTAAGDTVASTLPDFDGSGLPRRGDAEVDGKDYRVTTFDVPAWDGTEGGYAVRLLDGSPGPEVRGTTLAAAAALLGFLVLAAIFGFSLQRALQSQLDRLLAAARRLGAGDFSTQVPTEGGDEFAALGGEFNSMAAQLQHRMEELESERARLQHAIRRFGESLTKNLDRDALLELVVETAVDGVAASVGRARVRDASEQPLSEKAHVGEVDGYEHVLELVEAAALDGRAAADVHRGEHYAMSHPLRPPEGNGGDVIGLITVARGSRPFSGAEQELFNYLAGQTSVSMENVGLHETVRRQAVTDDLTGLFNHRRFQEVMAIEVERAKRFQQPLGLIMLDLDDFKQINDEHGHMQGDEVLREVARVLRDASREIDEPARYGGEEMAVALPQTDLEGAYQFAERLRGHIEQLEVPRIDGRGVLRVTASLGAAALPLSAEVDKDALVAAADAALYEAKRLGKNRVVRAG